MNHYSNLYASTKIDMEVAVRINPSRKLIEFSIQNYEDVDIECSRISIATNYIDENGYFIVRRHISIRDQVVKANDFHVVPERGQEIIDSLEGQYSNPRIRDFHGDINAKCIKRPGFLEMCHDDSITQEQKKTIKGLKRIVSETSCFNAYIKLNELKELSLAYTDISDLIPLRNLYNLKYLNIAENPVSDISPLTELTSLEKLYAHDTLVNDISSLAKLTKLTTLYLGNTRVSDIRPLAGLGNLLELHLGWTQITEIRPLSELTNLVKLYLQGTPVRNLNPIFELSHLLYLSLAATRVNDISPLADLTNLAVLNLFEAQVNDISPLRGLTKLVRLNIAATRVNDISPLADHSKLKWLDARNTQVISRDVEWLKQRLPDCQIKP